MRRKRDYSPGAVDRAVEAVKSGRLSIRKASVEFGVPRATINDHVQSADINERMGRPPVLSDEEESHIIVHIQVMADWGFPFSAESLCYFVQAYLNKKGATTRFTDNLPTRKWVRRFLGRHPGLRTANRIKRARASVSREDIQEFFANYIKAVEGVPPENLLNYDETNFADNPGTKKCLFKKGTKYCEKVKDPLPVGVLVRR
jgi:hypothetical protein